jgi:thioredoxin 1
VLVVTDKQTMEHQLNLVEELQEENRQLTEELFNPRLRGYPLVGDGDLPYDENIDALAMVNAKREKAVQDRKFLMVTFGANWCLDCRTLHRHLKSGQVADYTKDLFYFANVNVGKFNQNADIATELGVTLTKGIPVAIFFNPEGQLIGTTNEGQLEPARRYSSRQILKFIRDIAERSHILAPDAVQ